MSEYDFFSRLSSAKYLFTYMHMDQLSNMLLDSVICDVYDTVHVVDVIDEMKKCGRYFTLKPPDKYMIWLDIHFSYCSSVSEQNIYYMYWGT